jgi:cytochrome c
MESYMKSIIVSMFAAVGLMIAGSAMAVDMPAEGKAKCASCHAIDKKVVGPSWMDISKKYKGDKQAADKIAANITKGGSFGWKMGVMTPKGLGATDAEIKKLSAFIVGLAK